MAIDGGRPFFEAPRVTGTPNNIDRAAVYARLDEMFDSNRLTNNGPLVRELEERLAALLGVGDVVAVTNGTMALLIASVGLGARGDVLVPSWTFAGTVQPLVWAGLRPRFVDTDPRTHLVDPEVLAAAATDEVGLIVPVHLWGRPCEADRIDAVAADIGCPVLYDAAHAFGAAYRGTPIGNFGDAEIFSFHATKWMTCIEGGAIATNDGDLAQRCRRLRNFGFAGEGDIPLNGINAKMSELHAAVGLCQIRRFGELRHIHRERQDAYRSCLEGHDRIRLVTSQDAARSPNGYVIVEVDAPVPDPARAVQLMLEGERVLVRRYFAPGVHRLAAFERFADDVTLPVTDELSRRCVALPTGEAVTIEDVVAISGLLLQAVDRLWADPRIDLVPGFAETSA